MRHHQLGCLRVSAAKLHARLTAYLESLAEGCMPLSAIIHLCTYSQHWSCSAGDNCLSIFVWLRNSRIDPPFPVSWITSHKQIISHIDPERNLNTLRPLVLKTLYQHLPLSKP